MFDKPTRRTFLGTTAASAVMAGGQSIARAAHAGGDGDIKIGMIGCGGRCTGAARQSMKAGPDVKLVAMYDVFEDRVQAALKSLTKEAPNQVQVDEDHCFTAFDGYLHVIDSVDVVLIGCRISLDMYLPRADDAVTAECGGLLQNMA